VAAAGYPERLVIERADPPRSSITATTLQTVPDTGPAHRCRSCFPSSSHACSVDLTMLRTTGGGLLAIAVTYDIGSFLGTEI
jgi:hypothetical protein